MKVLVVLNSLAPGGTEQSTVLLAPRLRQRGVDVAIATLKPAAHELDQVAAASGIPVHRLIAGGFAHQFRDLRRLIRSERPDVVHTALFDADVLGRLAAWRTGIPVVSSFVSTPYDPARLADPHVKRWKLRLVQTIDAVTGRLFVRRFHAVSEGVKQANARALHIPLERITVAERGRDPQVLGAPSAARRAAARARLDIDDQAEVVLNLGRLEHQKAQVDLVRATDVLVSSHPNLVVLIAGKDGAAAPAVRAALNEQRSAARHVRLLGHRTDIGDLLSAADVLAISSHFEGTAGVALEAMALNVPIVSTDLDGLRGILTDGVNALLVERGNPVALADGIHRLLADRDLAARLADRGRADFEERFSLDAAAARLAALYRDVARVREAPAIRAPSPRS